MKNIRQGLTLLEILLVISLLGVLLGIVWSTSLMFAQMEKRRTLQIEQQRVVRTWTQMFNDDFRSAIQDTQQLNNVAGSGNIRHFGLTGISNQLRIDISDYSRQTTESPEIKTIFYEFQPVGGLVRKERDYTTFVQANGAVHIAPKIANGQFRYFDGGTWHEHWSSLDRKSAPSAIEITFQFLNPGLDEAGLNRVVVQIPAASPAFEEYQREQAPRSPEEYPSQPSAIPAQLPPEPLPTSPFYSLFGDD